jgi:predicted site-specific integrase-resolvase
VVLQASDVASGFNARRRGLARVVETAWRHEVRFRLVTLWVSLLLLNQEPEYAHDELVKAMLSVVTSFSAKL